VSTESRTTARTLSGLEGPKHGLRALVSSRADLPAEYSELAGIADAVSSFELVGGNKLEDLHNGEEAYPAMLQEIDRAEHHVLLSSYIFEITASCSSPMAGLPLPLA